MKTYYLIDHLTADLRQYDGVLSLEQQILTLPNGDEVSLYGTILCETAELACHNQHCTRRRLIDNASDRLDELEIQMRAARKHLGHCMAIKPVNCGEVQ